MIQDLWNILAIDWRCNRKNVKGLLIVTFFRVTNIFAIQRERNKILWYFGLPVMIAYRIIVEWLLCVELPAKASVGPGLVIYHGQGLVVYAGVKIGKNVLLRHNTTIGNKIRHNGTLSGAPIIGDNVDVGCNSVIIGEISVGNDAVIGAGAVVTKNVPAGAVVAGNPARVIGVQKL